MSKPNGKRYKLETVRRSYVEAVGGDRVEFEVGDPPQVLSIPHPMFMDDATQKQVDGAEGDEGKARALLGDQWEAFVQAGGDANSLMLLFLAVQGDARDTVQRVRPPRG